MALSADDLRKIREELLKTLKAQEDINKLSKDYVALIQKIKGYNKDILRLKEEEVKQQLALSNAINAGATQDVIDVEQAKLDIIRDEIAEREKIVKLLAKEAKGASKVKAIIKGTLEDVRKTKNFLRNAYNFFSLDDAFRMSKSIKTSALQMGVLSQQAESFSKDIQDAALNTVQYGLSIEEIAKMQAQYSDELGRTVMLGAKGAELLGQMAVSTGLGEEGAALFAANMDVIGLSVERTAEYVEQTMNDAHAMGLNSSKVIKNIQGNIKLLNKYNFKNGAKGLASMAQSAAKMNVSMESISGFADKLFDIEGAVEMSAQLQVMGGEWSKLADPFKLMYMARNDMDALFKSVVNATKGAAQFNSETGEFDISALELHRLRKIAEATGLSFDELAQSAKNAAKFTKIKGQMSFDVDEKTKDFLESTAKFSKEGKAIIRIDGVDKMIGALSESDKIRLNTIVQEREDMKQRANDSITLNKMLSNTVIMFKQLLVPLVDALNKRLKPALDGLVTKLKDPKFIDGIVKFTEGVGNFISGVGKFIIEWPKLTLGLFALFEVGKWYANGMALGAGFNSVAGSGGFMKSLMGGVGKSLLMGGAGLGINMLTDATTDKGSNANIVGKIAGTALEGAAIGRFLGPWGAAIGAILGGAYGGISSYMDKKELASQSTATAGLSAPNIPSIPNREVLMGAPPITTNNNSYSSRNMTIDFGELKLAGSVELRNGQGVSSELGRELLNTPSFIRELSKLIHVETARAQIGPTQQKVG